MTTKPNNNIYKNYFYNKKFLALSLLFLILSLILYYLFTEKTVSSLKILDPATKTLDNQSEKLNLMISENAVSNSTAVEKSLESNKLLEQNIEIKRLNDQKIIKFLMFNDDNKCQDNLLQKIKNNINNPLMLDKVNILISICNNYYNIAKLLDELNNLTQTDNIKMFSDDLLIFNISVDQILNKLITIYKISYPFNIKELKQLEAVKEDLINNQLDYAIAKAEQIDNKKINDWLLKAKNTYQISQLLLEIYNFLLFNY